MEPIRVGHAIRALRLRRRWRQVDLGSKAGVSASIISRIEHGRLDAIALGTLGRVVAALDAGVDVRIRWNGEALDRLLDQAPAGLVEQVVTLLRANGWVTEVEASFSIYGERGSVDVLAHHRTAGMVLVTEVKSVVPDSQATIAGLDRKSRLAPDLARERGWISDGVARLLVIGDSSTSRRRVDALSATYRTTFPVSGQAVLRWLRQPEAPIAGLLFLPYMQPTHGRASTTGMQRVRRPRPARERSHSCAR